MEDRPVFPKPLKVVLLIVGAFIFAQMMDRLGSSPGQQTSSAISDSNRVPARESQKKSEAARETCKVIYDGFVGVARAGDTSNLLKYADKFQEEVFQLGDLHEGCKQLSLAIYELAKAYDGTQLTPREKDHLTQKILNAGVLLK